MLEKEEIVSPALEDLKSHYRSIITLLGEDAEREGLLKTPERVAKAMLSLTKGYHMDPHEVLRSAKFKEEYSQMVIVKDIDFFSLCEHHMLPFYGKAHVAYIPSAQVTSKQRLDSRISPPVRSNGSGIVNTYGHADAWGGKAELDNYHF